MLGLGLGLGLGLELELGLWLGLGLQLEVYSKVIPIFFTNFPQHLWKKNSILKFEARSFVPKEVVKSHLSIKVASPYRMPLTLKIFAVGHMSV